MSQQTRVLRGERRIVGPLVVVNPDVAGIDAGSREHWVSVPEDRDANPVQKFGVFTEDLYALADWLDNCGIRSVAVEATGVYWIPLVEVLEARGFEVKLVDSHSIGKRTKKTDVTDCQWIRQLHMYGLLQAAFRPEADILPFRAYMRRRQMLVSYAADHIRHMQKALDLMNYKLHTVITDITGVTGLKIIEAILSGERNPETLAKMRDPKCKNSEEVIAKALMGNCRKEHVGDLRAAYELFNTYQTQIAMCDAEIEIELREFDRKALTTPQSTSRATSKRKRRKNQPHFDGRKLLHDMVGVDLTAVDGFDVASILGIIAETGTLLDKFDNEARFVSWLHLCCNDRITGGKKIWRKAPNVKANRASQIFRLCAQSQARAQNWIGAFFRRKQAHLGFAGAVKATAAKLARVFFSMVKNKTEYAAPEVNYYEQRYRANLTKALERRAKELGFTLTPVDALVPSGMESVH